MMMCISTYSAETRIEKHHRHKHQVCQGTLSLRLVITICKSGYKFGTMLETLSNPAGYFSSSVIGALIRECTLCASLISDLNTKQSALAAKVARQKRRAA